MALGKTLLKIRESKGLSQEALSKLTGWTDETPQTGVSQGAISAIEKRDSYSSRHAPALAKALGVSIEQLMGGESTVYKVEEARDEYIDPVIADLAALEPEDADVWRAQIKAAAIKARKLNQEKSDRTPEVRASDHYSGQKRTA
jgi:transcriptional regulator with XRE-family HTH domain